MSDRKPASNKVIVWIGKEIRGEFDPQPRQDGDKTIITPAATQASQFLEGIFKDRDHEFHKELTEQGYWMMNGNPEFKKPEMQYVL